MNTILKSCILSSFQIIIIILIRSLLVYKIKKGFFIIFWYSVVITLIFPFLPSKFLLSQESALAVTPIWVDNNISLDEYIPLLHNATIVNQSAVPFISKETIFFLWLSVGISIFIFNCLLHGYYLTKFKTATLMNNSQINAFVKDMGFKRKIIIKESPYVSSPLTYGLLHPNIIFPLNFEISNFSDLTLILMHELSHIARCDIILKWLLTILISIYWFNPLVWIMYILCNRDIEMACDESVLKKLGLKNKKSYALLLINMEAQHTTFSNNINNFNKNAINERIIAMMKTKKCFKNSFITAIASVTMCFVFCVTVYAESNIIASADTEIFEPFIKDNIIWGPTDTWNNNIISGYDQHNETNVISSDGGKTWFEGNEYKDPITNLTYHFDEENGRTVSPDDGNLWYSDYYVENVIITCTKTEITNDTEISYYAISKNLGETWEYSQDITTWFTYEDYKEYVIDTITFLNECLDNNIPLKNSDNETYYLTEDDVRLQTDELMNNLIELKNGNLKISTDFNYIVNTN